MKQNALNDSNHIRYEKKEFNLVFSALEVNQNMETSHKWIIIAIDIKGVKLYEEWKKVLLILSA